MHPTSAEMSSWLTAAGARCKKEILSPPILIVTDKQDRRFLRTEKLIKTAFISLLAEKSFAELSIKDITDRAEIGRGTFYKHYADKNALLFSFEERIRRDLEQKPYPKFMQNREDYVRKKILFRYQYFAENIDMMRSLFGQNGDAAFQQRMRDFIWKDLYIEEEDVALVVRRDKIPPEYVSIINTTASFVFDVWLKKEDPESPEEIVDIIVHMTGLAKYKILD